MDHSNVEHTAQIQQLIERGCSGGLNTHDSKATYFVINIHATFSK